MGEAKVERCEGWNARVRNRGKAFTAAGKMRRVSYLPRIPSSLDAYSAFSFFLFFWKVSLSFSWIFCSFLRYCEGPQSRARPVCRRDNPLHCKTRISLHFTISSTSIYPSYISYDFSCCILCLLFSISLLSFICFFHGTFHSLIM